MRVNGRDSANHEKINCPPLNRVEIDRENQICETPGTNNTVAGSPSQSQFLIVVIRPERTPNTTALQIRGLATEDIIDPLDTLSTNPSRAGEIFCYY